MMNAQRLNGNTVMPALTYANQQIDHFVSRGRLTFSELAVMVEAIYAMSGVSGGLVFAYAIKARAKCLVVDERGYFTLQDVTSEIDHVIPTFLRELPFYTDHKVKFEDLKQFVPLFATTLGAQSVVLKNIVWIKSLQRNGLHIPLLMSSVTCDAATVANNRHASVSVPIAYLQGSRVKCGLIQLPASAFDQLQIAVAQGMRTVRIRKSHLGPQQRVEIVQEKELQALSDKRIQAVVGEFWHKFVEYSDAVSAQNAKMPRNVMDAITHTMINSQKSLPELSSLLF